MAKKDYSKGYPFICSRSGGPVIFNNTVLRDGHQSLAATRMTTEQMLPACGPLDSLGFGALETWGGATVDSGLRFLNEFPFDRLDKLYGAAPKTPHMMLLRGQNLLQYTHFADDVVDAFVRCSVKHGMAVFRIFDALNDVRNIESSVKATIGHGGHAQGTICYTDSPVHSVEAFVRMGKELEDMGCHSICLKDMAGLVPPVAASRIVSGLKKETKLPIILHSHETAGLAADSYYAAIEAGVDAVDTSISPFANGTGQPDTMRMLSLLRDHPRCPEYDRELLRGLQEHFTKVYAELSEFTSHRNEVIDADALLWQVPGGMLSNFRNQLKEQKMEDRFEEVFGEIRYVREKLGWIPLVTPTSQIVGVQAVMNVKFGRWKVVTPQAANLALGYYGRTPAPVDPDVIRQSAKSIGKDPITCRPADLQPPAMEGLRSELAAGNFPTDDEHAVIYAMFPAELTKLMRGKGGQEAKPAKTDNKQPAPGRATAAPAGTPPKGGRHRYTVTIEGKSHSIEIAEL